MKRALLSLLVALLIPVASQAEDGKRSRIDIQPAPSSPPVVAPAHPGSPGGLQQAPASGVLASWNFDLGGGPDLQGWTTADLQSQPAYFHIDNFAGDGSGIPGFGPLAGTKSLWCGRQACDSPPTTCDLYSDGYGNDWEQSFYSVQFSVTGDVTIQFLLKYDSEFLSDKLELYYAGQDQILHLLRTWSGTGTESVSQIISGTNLGGKISFRFQFTSDGVYSNEDGGYPSHGAAIIDNILISTPTQPTVDSQTFESVANGLTYTPDFHWFGAGTPVDIGDFSGLFHGSTVLQLDPSYTNTTYFWGFFLDSPDNYACGGHPEQATPPLTPISTFPRPSMSRVA